MTRRGRWSTGRRSTACSTPWPTAEAAIAAVPVVDTIKRAESGIAAGTVDRSGLWQAQTPQGFRFPALLAAHRAAAGEALTDDAAVAERQGIAVRLVEGHVDNFKITTEADLTRAERLLGGAADIRTGTGFDVHRLITGDAVILCGIRIPHPAKLDGHSDADVGLHALTDALLGAIGAGDIGQHFPPSDERWRGADSAAFLAHAADLVRARGTHPQRRRHADLRAAEDRPAPRRHGGADRRDPRHRRRAGQRQGDHDRAARLHRPRGGHRRPGLGERADRALMPSFRPLPPGCTFWQPSTLLATVGGIGLIRVASGTWGSLAALPLAWLLWRLGGPAAVAIAGVAIGLVGIWAAGARLPRRRGGFRARS